MSNRACRKLNRLYFNSNQALWFSDDCYLLNTAALAYQSQTPTVATYAPTSHHTVPVIATIPAARTMQVNLPPDCKPGSVITATAPSGETLQITVPEHAQPGSSIIVTY